MFRTGLHNGGNILLILSCSIWYTVFWKVSFWEKLTLKWKRTNCLHDRCSIYIGWVMSKPMFLTVYKTEKIFCHLFWFNQIFGFLKFFIFRKMSVKVKLNRFDLCRMCHARLDVTNRYTKWRKYYFNLFPFNLILGFLKHFICRKLKVKLEAKWLAPQ